MNKKDNDGFLSTREIIKREGLFPFIKSRILTLKEIAFAIQSIREERGGLKNITLPQFVWYSRYVNFKAIEDYDYR